MSDILRKGIVVGMRDIKAGVRFTSKGAEEGLNTIGTRRLAANIKSYPGGCLGMERCCAKGKFEKSASEVPPFIGAHIGSDPDCGFTEPR